MLNLDALRVLAFFALMVMVYHFQVWRLLRMMAENAEFARQFGRRTAELATTQIRLARCERENRELSEAVGLLQYYCEQAEERLDAFEDVEQRQSRPKLDGRVPPFGAFGPH